MGGNNFKSNVRLPAKEYNKLSSRLYRLLRYRLYEAGLVQEIPVPVKSYETKDSFGDIDFICAGWNSGEVAGKLYDILFEEKLIYMPEAGFICIGPCTSYPIATELGCFQLDMIGGFSLEESDFAYWYFAYNDLGNFVGRFAHKIGLKFGHRGLFYPLHWQDAKGKDHFLGDIQLSTDFNNVVEFLGFDYSRWVKGFYTMEEIYEMVCDHPMFHPCLFDLKDVSHNARVRDKKRKSYSNLLLYIDARFGHIEYNNPWKGIEKWQYLDWINSEFPILEIEMKRKISEHLLKQELASRWNGSLIMEQSELAGHKIQGKAIGEFNSEYKPSDVQLLKMSQTDISTYIYDQVKEFVE